MENRMNPKKRCIMKKYRCGAQPKPLPKKWNIYIDGKKIVNNNHRICSTHIKYIYNHARGKK